MKKPLRHSVRIMIALACLLFTTPIGCSKRTEKMDSSSAATTVDHPLVAYVNPPITLSHTKGGLLHISASTIRLRISADVIKLDPEHSDMIVFNKSIFDDSGQQHTFSTVASAYDLWDSISGTRAYLEDAYLTSWHFPNGSELVPLATNLNIWSDGREPRTFGIVADNQKPAVLFSFTEKYFSATADLLIQHCPAFDTGLQPADKVVARLTPHRFIADGTGTLELNDAHRILIPIHSRLVLFDNLWRKSVVDREIGPTWNRGDLPQAITVSVGEGKGPPQSGVTWTKE